MTRWGEEEKKSKGLFGCAIAFGILAVAIYVFVINYKNLEDRRNLEVAMQDIIRSGYDKTAEVMIGEILDTAEEMELEQINSDSITLTKTMDDFNNPLVNVHIRFDFVVDVLVHKFEIQIPIAEEVPIIMF